MASPRSPSPLEATSSPPGTPLTPQSKIRALLATVDSSSDEEPRPRAKKAASPKQRTTTQSPTTRSSPSSSSDDDEDILRPRGKLAARMLAESNAPRKSPPRSKEDARERVKKFLQAGSEPNSPPKSTNEDKHSGDDDEDEVVTARPRKLKPRPRQRSKTPETVNPEPTQSPGLFVSPNSAPASSPGLFVSPAKPASPSIQSNAAGSGSDDDLPSIHKERFAALVAKKRKERLAKEAEEAKKKEARLAAQLASDDRMSDEGDESNVTDDEGGRRLTQDARPARKASKKALEEMNRETQRLSRNLQLAHEAKTKKKISKSALFERFNFKPTGGIAEDKPLQSSSRPSSPASPHPGDTMMGDADTPPSSPPSVMKGGSDVEKPGQVMDGVLAPAAEGSKTITLDKGKGKATLSDLEDSLKPLPQSKRAVRVKLPTVHANLVTLGSDDELDVQPARQARIDAIFARAPRNKTQESRSLQALRLLAQVNDPEKKAATTGKDNKPGMTSGELLADLQQRARQQAKLERDRRLDLLKAKGIHVQTQEERENEMAEVEDIVARARAEAEEIMTREREAAKKEKREKRAAGELDPLAWDDSESDDDYEDVELAEVELSGSEDELEEDNAEIGSEDGTEGEADDEEADNAPANGGLFDAEADSTGESEDDETREMKDVSDSEADEAPALKKAGRHRPKKHVTIISDDESDISVDATPKPKTTFPKSPSAPNTASPKVPTSVLRSATKTFIPGLTVAGPAGLGLTQIFAGTMDDDSQAGIPLPSPSQMMPSFNQAPRFPDSNFSQSTQGPAEDMMVLDSQPTQNAATTLGQETQGVQIRFSQSQMHGFDSMLRDDQHGSTQLSEFIEPTQDGGFRDFTPLKQRFVELPASTVETMALGSNPAEDVPNDSPLVQKTAKKLRRRSDMIAARAQPSSEDEAEIETIQEEEEDEFGFGTSAFNVLKDAAIKEKRMKAKQAFDKKKSKAREMVDEQAEESEDEYAGLGGADGDASSDEDAASVHEMIDDETKGNEGDDAKLAAFYA